MKPQEVYTIKISQKYITQTHLLFLERSRVNFFVKKDLPAVRVCVERVERF